MTDLESRLAQLAERAGWSPDRFTVRVDDATCVARYDSATFAGRYGAVSTPGDRWISIDLDSGFVWDCFEEDMGVERLDDLALGAMKVLRLYCDVESPVEVGHSWMWGRTLRLDVDNATFDFRKPLSVRLRDERRRVWDTVRVLRAR